MEELGRVEEKSEDECFLDAMVVKRLAEDGQFISWMSYKSILSVEKT